MSTVIDWNKYKQASDDEKIQMLKDGAEKGDALCQFGYGYHLVEKDNVTAMHWFEESAKQGFILAYHALGFYSTGSKAWVWLSQSVERGCTASWLALGYCYENCPEVRDRFLHTSAILMPSIRSTTKTGLRRCLGLFILTTCGTHLHWTVRLTWQVPSTYWVGSISMHVT